MGGMASISDTPIDELPAPVRKKVQAAHKALARANVKQGEADAAKDRFLAILHQLQTDPGPNGTPVGSYRQFGFMFQGPGMSYESIRQQLMDWRRRNGVPQVTSGAI